jgi:hypothetical protein
MSFFFVTVGYDGRTHLTLRSFVENEQRTAVATWKALERPDQAELGRISRVYNFYRLPHSDPAKLPAEGRGPKGGYRYPTDGGWKWRNETPSFELATKRWKEAGHQTVMIYESGVLRHDQVMESNALSLSAPWYVNLVPCAKVAAEFLMLAVPWFVLCSLVGDIVRSVVLLLARLFGRDRAALG